MLSTTAELLPPGSTAANSGRPALAPAKPTMPTAMIISGNDTPKKKIATNAAPAMATKTGLRSARFPTRNTAWMTMASTAAFRPKNNASTTLTLP
jgi:hypothetical protein